MVTIAAGVARINGIQSVAGQIPLNHVVGWPAHATLPRIDTVIANTPGVFPPDPTFDTQVKLGTASASPVPPTMAEGELRLYDMLVPAGATDSSQCTLTDRRTYTVSSRVDTPTPLISPNGTRYRIIVANDGALTSQAT